MRRALFCVMVIMSGLIISCKKDKKNPDNNGDDGSGPTKDGSALDLMRDSVWLYAKQAYYWYDAIPTYGVFKPRNFSAGDDLSALQKEVDALSQYKINPDTKQPYEFYAPNPGEAKYSFIDVAGVASKLNATQGDFGFAPVYNGDEDIRVKYVYAGSPADKAGLKRGDRITSINGNSNLKYDGSSGPHTNFVINAYTNSSTITMTLIKADASTVNVTLNIANYSINPVITYKVLNTSNSRKVGYIVFNSFTSDAIADGPLDAAFNYFATNGVTDLVVDLRYNGGGYVSTAEHLSNLIAPASKTGSLMYNTYFNDILANGKGTILANQVRINPNNGKPYNYSQIDYSVAAQAVNFNKVGSLNVSRVFFIVSGNTASASELVINNIKAVISDVKLIGTTTFGKPVGFFDIKINKYEMYIPEFETKNSAGAGGYYSGMTPGSATYPGKLDKDDASKEFGDPNERLLKYALNYVTLGAFESNSPKIQTTDISTFSIEQANEAAKSLTDSKYHGLFYDKPVKLKN